MLAEMASYYDELKDHDVPPPRPMGPSHTRSEMSLNLDDLEDMRGSLHRRSRPASGTSLGGSPNNSNLSLSSWTNEPEATTGNIMMLGGSSLAGYWRASSLDSVFEGDDQNSDDDEYRSSADGSFRKNDSVPIGRRPRHNMIDSDESLLPAIDESSKADAFVRSSSWDGCLLDDPMAALNLRADEDNRRGRRVHFEVPARLEDIREFEKPDFEDYNDIWYMAHELQKMSDEAKKEIELSRNVVR